MEIIKKKKLEFQLPHAKLIFSFVRKLLNFLFLYIVLTFQWVGIRIHSDGKPRKGLRTHAIYKNLFLEIIDI